MAGEFLSWKEARLQPHLILLGPPGSGKTSCLRRIALEEASKRRDQRHLRLPVYLQLRELTRDCELLTTVAHKLGQRSKDSLDDVLDSGRLLLMLDGADEMPPEEGCRLWREVDAIRSRFPLIGIYLTVRDAGFDYQPSGFTKLRLEPFDLQRQQEWISKRMGRTHPTLASQLLALIQTNDSIRALSGNPLFLAICAAYIERARALPRQMSTLLLKYTEALLDDWDQARGVARWAPLQVPKERKLEVLCRAAFKAFERQGSFFFQNEFEYWEACWSDREFPKLAAEILWRHTGILTRAESDDRRWHFSNSVLTEFLAAKYLVDRPDDPFPELATRIGIERLHSIWTHACAMTPDATPLFELMMHRDDWDRLARTSLIARAILEEANIPHDVLSKSCHFVADTVAQCSLRIRNKDEPGGTVIWFLEITEHSPGEPEGQCTALYELLRILITGLPTKRRLRLSEDIGRKGGRVCRILSALIATGGTVDRISGAEHSSLKLARGRAPTPVF